MPTQFSSIVDLLQSRAEHQSQQDVFVFLEGGEAERERLNFAQLDHRARAIAARLQSEAPAGARILLLYPSGLDFICAWLGCVYAGMVAVPGYLPTTVRSPHRLRTSLQRLGAIVRNCDPALALLDAGAAAKITVAAPGAFDVLHLKIAVLDTGYEEGAADWKRSLRSADELAMLQYTSGSTGTPKGVMISHGNIIANMGCIAAAGGLDAHSSMVSWLPMFHDMGLFGKVLLPIYLGSLSVLMDPAAFVQKPERWLRAISKYRGFLSAAPDSAYELCVRKIGGGTIDQLDLSSWKIAYNGAEPVRRGTVEQFSAKFSACGFRAATMRPVYGMAEATLFISGQAEGAAPILADFDSEGLTQRRARPPHTGGTRTLVSCGQAWTDHRLRIVDPDSGQACADNQIGEIWFGGPSVGLGYWNRPEESATSFAQRLPDDERTYMRTGDLGFVNEQGLFVTGRVKDLIIVSGRNHYPQDLERTAESSYAALAPNASAAFSVDGTSENMLVLACEIQPDALQDFDLDVAGANIRQAVADEHGLQLHAIAFLKPHALPRTSSGKVQRSRTQRAFVAGDELDLLGEWRKQQVMTAGSAS